jgi:hypothetical protein
MSDIVIDGNNIHDFYTGPQLQAEVAHIFGDVNHFQITNNVLTNVRNIGLDVIGIKYDYCNLNNVVNQYPHNGVISGNTITNWGGPYGENSGLYVDGAHDVVIENNFLNGGTVGLVVSVEQPGAVTENIIVRKNVVKNALKSYYIGASAGGGNTNNSRFVHNVGVTTTTGKSSNYYLGQGSGLIAKNNISYWAASGNFYMLENGWNLTTSVTLDYNDYYPASGVTYWYGNNAGAFSTFAAYSAGKSQDLHSITSDPLFTSVSGNDFTLQSGSPDIDAGTYLTTTVGGGTGTVITVGDARYFHKIGRAHV